jgi:pimeloyl-ACP methyl ester carboxylesterase
MRLWNICGAGLLWLAFPHSAISALVTEDCRLSSPWLTTVSAQCGILTVPEDAAIPDGRQVDLFVVRLPSLSGAPQPDPVVLISGGPGQATTDLFLSLRTAFEPLRRERDIILVDQRGTGRSTRLDCPSADAEDLETADPDELRELVIECVAGLNGDPRYYTTSVAVNDLESLRVALEVPEWNIYGISYGSRVAQHYLRRYPESTRALILDGVAPAELALGPAIATSAQNALDLILSRCANDVQCSGQFPDLEQQLATVSSRLAEGPLTVAMPDPLTGEPGNRILSDRHLQTVIRLMSYAPPTAALLPLIVSEAYDGNYVPLTAQAYMMIGNLQESISFPMHNSVVCTEDVPFFAGVDVTSLGDTYLGTTIIDALQTVCSVWPLGVRDDDIKAPLESTQPILLLSGEADPVTPPAYGEQVRQNLPNARHLVGIGQGHGLAAVGCVPALMRRFVQDLDPLGLDAECLERERPTPFFLDFTGPSP